MEKTAKKNSFLSLKDKMQILKKLENGEKQCQLSKEYGIGSSTITRWKQNKKQMQRALRNNMNNSSRRTIRESCHPKMESALYTWCVQLQNMGAPVTGIMLRLKACELVNQLKESDVPFHGSAGWMERFEQFICKHVHM